MDTYACDCVVVGAGVVGLASAAAVARSGGEVIVLEAGPMIGSGTSSRNSEVIHAGIYYPEGSLKHRLCVAGRRQLYAYLKQRGVAHRKCGKLIVATDAREAEKLEAIYAQAQRNGVEGMDRAGQRALAGMEPELHAVEALISPETGIVDSHGLMLALQGEIEDAGGAIAFNSPLLAGKVLADGRIELEVGGEHPSRITCVRLINAAGLHAHEVAAKLEGGPAAPAPLTLAKGSYFSYAGRPAFSRLIYPVPVDGGLGVHVTLDLAGRMRFGPDVEWLETRDPDVVDYAVDVARAEVFYAAIRRYWPGLPDGALQADYAGCRPKLSGAGQAAADFTIQGPDEHGVAGLVHLFGIESPGLTSALAIADVVAGQLS